MKCDYCPVEKGCKVFKQHSGFERACARRLDKWKATASAEELAYYAALEDGKVKEEAK